jgi:hypothetical protein
MEGKMASSVEVVVVKTPKGYVVRPAYVVVGRGDTLVWQNLTHRNPEHPVPGEAIEISFPDSHALGAPRLLDAVHGDFALEIPRDAAPGFHPYAVFSQRARDYCVGESTPGVIIKR